MRLRTCRWLRSGWFSVGIWTLLLGTTGAAEARPRQEVDALASQLASPELQARFEAIDRLATLGTTEAIEQLAGFVRDGQPDAATDHVVAALGLHPRRSTFALLVELTRHRRAAVRIGAYTALARIAGRDVTELVSEGLRDGQAEVRAHSATLLGERGDAGAVEVLFLAFERGVSEAADALGRLAPASDLPRYGAYLERRALHVMLAGYTNFLDRDDIDEASKLHVIATLEQVSGPLVKQWLRTQLARRTRQSEQRVRFAIAASLARVVENPGTEDAKATPDAPKGPQP